MIPAVCLCATLISSAAVGGEVPQDIDKVIKKDGKVLMVQGSKTGPLSQNVTFPNQLKITTNGVFVVGNGKERELKEGQTLTKDGLLYNVNGSVSPVIDHITLRSGHVYVVKNGEAAPLGQNMLLANGSVLSPDGTMRAPSGRIVRLLDGNVLKLDGAALDAKDTISLIDGKLVVHKDGGLVHLAAGQKIIMNDGTQVFANGTVLGRDGSIIPLKEGETITLQGPVLSAR